MRIIKLLIAWLIVTNPAASQLSVYPVPDRVKLTDSIDCTQVKDQGLSPTCWVFGTYSVMESDLIRLKGIRMNISEMFVARYAYIDKARQYLATGGKSYFEGGGQFHDVIRVIRQYGLVPEEVYSGRQGEKFTHDHRLLDTAMKRLVHGWQVRGKKSLSDQDLIQLNDTLDKFLGKVPQQFIWKGKTYTPHSFAREQVNLSDDYAELVSFSDKPLYRQFVLADKYNWANDSFWNISLKDMQEVVDTALARGWSVGWEGDVTEPGFNYYGGYASIPDSAFQFDQQRLENYKTEVTERDHMLHLTATGVDATGKKWYYLKNSWGTWLSRYKGFLFMEENYFRMKTVILFVNKKALPESLRKKLKL